MAKTHKYYIGRMLKIDLTKIFGEGKEQSREEFERMFPASYYDYEREDKK